jgi:hypothetical protein
MTGLRLREAGGSVAVTMRFVKAAIQPATAT